MLGIKIIEIYLVNIAVFHLKGLVAVGERAQKRSGNFSAAMKDLSGEKTLLCASHLEFVICSKSSGILIHIFLFAGKHPVSALMEICNKRRWQPPEFLLVHDSGPDHRKHFLFRVNMHF